MAIIRRTDPFAGITTIHQELDELFNNFMNQPAISSSAADMPIMDVYKEDDKELVSEVHLPGFSPEDIKMTVRDNILEIQGERRQKEEHKGKKRSYMLRQSSESFFRSIALPKNADPNKIDATFEDGLLRVKVPFKKTTTAKQISIRGKSSRAKKP